jgi:hypothetical protein
MRKPCVAIALIASFAVLAGCASTPPKAVYTPNFSFQPPSTAAPGSANITFALIKPVYSADLKGSHIGDIAELVASSMRADFQQQLAARGYNVRGPFDSYEDITFPDKQNSDLALSPLLELTFNEKALGRESVVRLLGTNTMKTNYTGTLGGKITFSIIGPLSKERMWFKSLDVPTTSVNFGIEDDAVDKSIPQAQREQILRALEAAYADAMQKAWTYLDPGEIATVRDQSLTIREKKRY